MKNKPELETKYLKVLTTKDQREIIEKAINYIMIKYDVKEGRAMELICLSHLASDDNNKNKNGIKDIIEHLLSLLDKLYEEYKKHS